MTIQTGAEFSATMYYCEPCTQSEGRLVKQLIRVIPEAVVVFGRMVGEEHWGCPVCLEPKFPVKQKKPRGFVCQPVVLPDAQVIPMPRR